VRINEHCTGLAGHQRDVWQIENPQGKHAIGVGIDAPVEVEIKGQSATIAAA